MILKLLSESLVKSGFTCGVSLGYLDTQVIETCLLIIMWTPINLGYFFIKPCLFAKLTSVRSKCVRQAESQKAPGSENIFNLKKMKFHVYLVQYKDHLHYTVIIKRFLLIYSQRSLLLEVSLLSLLKYTYMCVCVCIYIYICTSVLSRSVFVSTYICVCMLSCSIVADLL